MKTIAAVASLGLVLAFNSCTDSKPATNSTTAPSVAKTPASRSGGGEASIPIVSDAKGSDHPLLNPSSLNATSPDKYTAKFDTSAGEFTVDVTRSWAPQGADRFYNLVKNGFYDGAVFFRVIQTPRPFMVQFGINADPAVNSKWQTAKITDDPVTQSNTRGYITFATSGKDSRTTQVFINYGNNARLDGMGFSPFGEVAGDGMRVVDAINGEYGEGAPRGRGPSQGKIQSEGNAYLSDQFSRMDYIKSATIVE